MVRDEVTQATEAVRALEGPAVETAEAIEAAFERAGRSLAGSLARAAADGKLSLRELAGAVLGAAEAVAGSSGASGLGSVLQQVLSAVGQGFAKGFEGARADGGFVGAGGAYVVGERGPEVFRPAVSGTVEAASGGPTVQVTVVVQGGPEALARSEAQVASALSRAARMGLRG